MKSFSFRARTFAMSFAFLLTAAFSTSCGETSGNLSIPGVNGPTMTLQDDSILVTMTFENFSLDGGIRYNIPEYNNSYIEISPDLQSAGTIMAVSIGISDVFDETLQFLPAQQLPGGRNLPGVASGSLPAVAFTVDFLGDMTFYLGPKFFGFFVPFEMDSIGTGNIITARFMTGSIRAGNLSLVGPDSSGENGGFLLLLDLSSTVKRQLKRLI